MFSRTIFLRTALFLLLAMAIRVLASGQAITVTSPKSGDMPYIGDALFISWQSDTSVAGVSIEISLDNGNNYLPLNNGNRIYKEDDPAGWGRFAWLIPDTILDGSNAYATASEQCRIRIIDYYRAPIAEAVSPGFTIQIFVKIENGKIQGLPAKTDFNSRTVTLTSSVGLEMVSVFSLRGQLVFSMDGENRTLLKLPGEQVQLLAAGRYVIRAITMNHSSTSMPWVFVK